MNEAKHKWQWTKSYQAVAKESQSEAEYRELLHQAGIAIDDPVDYNIQRAWESMRKRHATECWNFIHQHQAATLDHYEKN